MAGVAVNLLKDEFAAGDLDSKFRAAAKLDLLANVLGPEKTCSELLPALSEIIQANREADEVLFVLSKSVLQLLDRVGSNYVALLGPLEILSVVEETTVRERAVKCMQVACERMTPAECSSDVMPLMKRLAEAEWFTPRRSACGILSPVYNKVDAAQRGEVLEIMNHLVADETPMVRRAVASAISGMALAPNGTQVAIEKLHPIWMTLTEDPHFSVRVCAVDTTGSLVQAVGKDSSASLIVPHCANKLATSRGWRVRFALAGQLGALAEGMSGEASKTIVPIAAKLCRDFEDDVSEVALTQITSIAKAISKDEGDAGLKAFSHEMIGVLNYVAGVDDERKMESSPRLRRAVAKCTIELAELNPKLLGTQCIDIWERFLTDNKSKDGTDVSRVTIEGLKSILSSLGAEFSMSSKWGTIVKNMYENSKSKAVDELNAQIAANQSSQNQQMGDALPGDPVETPKWRVRVYIVQNLGSLIASDKAQALQIWASALSDEAFEVRLASGKILGDLCKSGSAIGGAEGVAKDMVPLLAQFYKKSKETSNYQHRVSALHCAAELSDYPPAWAAAQSIVAESLEDKVTNVVLAALTDAKNKSEIKKTFKDAIVKLTQHSDQDIKEFAEQVGA